MLWQVNPIIFQIQTISQARLHGLEILGERTNCPGQIPAGGGLFIEGPLGFEFPNPCTPEAWFRVPIFT